MEITDVLGRSRTVDKVFPAGEWNCPFCTGAVRPAEPCTSFQSFGAHPAHCPNPACFANPHYPVERAREQLAEAEARAREEAQRKSTHEWAMKRAEEDREARRRQRAAVIQEAHRRGACATCALLSIRFKAVPKYTKHRGKCTAR